ncbi:MAG: CDP-glycerol glycerophosphotransferase family protein [Fuerstiella sp.]
MKKKVSILSSFGFAKRNLKSSCLADKLRASGYDVGVDDCLRRSSRWEGHINGLKYSLTRQLYHRFGEIQGFRKHLARREHCRDPDVGRWDAYNAWHGFPFPESRACFNFLDWIYRHLPSDFSSAYKPDLVLLTDMQDLLGQNAIQYCERHGIPVICINSSWDHLTHRGRVIDSPAIHKFLVWNEVQREEIQGVHGVDLAKVGIIGALQFDSLYHGKSFDRRAIRCGLQLEDNEKLLFLPAYNARHGCYEPRIVEWILGQNFDWMPKYRIVIRPYPGDTTFDERFARVLDNDNVTKSELIVDEVADFRSMSELLATSDIVLTGASTAAIEAMYYDTPVIHLAVDSRESRDTNELFKKYFFSDHYQHIMKHDASHYVQTFDELAVALREGNIHPERKKAGRRAVIAEQVYFDDGRSAERIIEEVARLFGESLPDVSPPHSRPEESAEVCISDGLPC